MAKAKKLLKGILLGKALKSCDLENEKLNRVWGVPIMASDAVSSVAYAIEEILIVLVPAMGFFAINYVGFIALPIVLLLLVLIFSYSQIINTYPNGGGAYIVASENIGKPAALAAAGALIVDYVMTVAVSLSAATAAFIAAFPEFAQYRILIAFICLLIITLLNLRGVRESSKVFGVPTYGFILIMAGLIVTGLVRMATGTLTPISYENAAVATEGSLQAITMILFLRAFSSGCSALTGVEAVSNAVPSFRGPSQKNAKHVLYILGGIIVFLFGGSTLLAINLRVVPVEGLTVISQMGKAVFGGGVLFYILQFATSLILLLAANTAYNGLPTLLAILGKDGYMPRQFMQRGTRLSFSNGIIFIFVAAALLLVIFKANTHHLMPLYAVGVFMSFTLSQSGMVIKWFRNKDKGWKHKMLINGIGALMTAAGTVIVFLTKFALGSWILAIVIPLICLVMYHIHKHYEFVKNQLKVDDFMAHYHVSVSTDNNLCVVLASSMSRSVLKSLNYANLMTSNVVALHISADEKQSEQLKEQWDKTGIDIPLKIIRAPYRDILEPLQCYIDEQEQNIKPGDTISVVLVRFIQERWFDNVLHNQTTYAIEKKLRKYKNVATIIIPYIYSTKYSPAEHNE